MKLTALALLTAVGLSFALPSMAAETAPVKPDHGKHMEKMFEKVDTDKDGVITKDESAAAHEKMFARKDLNKDGKLTKEEIKEAHAQWKAKREAGKDLNK